MHASSPMFALMIPIFAIAVPVALGCHHAARKRQLEHVERMKALEMGLPLPGASAWPAVLCIAIGAVVPIAALVVGLVATILHTGGRGGQLAHMGPDIVFWDHVRSTNYYAVVWTGSGAVGVAGIVGGTLLALKLLGSRSRGRDAATAAKAAQFDPDAYDTVGRRG